MVLNKNKVAKAFSKASPNYDGSATLQKEVAVNLIGKPPVPMPSLTSGIVVDIGSGTGTISGILKDAYKDAAVTVTALDISEEMSKKTFGKIGSAIRGDFDYLPIKENTVDLITSSLAFQWSDDFKIAAEESFRTLKSGGMLTFSTLTEGTLEELYLSINKAKEITDFKHDLKLLSYLPKDKIFETLEEVGFKKVQMRYEIIIKEFDDMWHLLKSLKEIGANSAVENSGGAFSLKTLLKEANTIYKDNFSPDMDGKVTATYEVGYFGAVK